ncbi:hypothetical protein AYO42_00475 [Rhizomicrobium sp. SCGC AG-212-E05]|nr:hypothetical protein AYO42_00475 [Rhizomicrobium sp. SCGC AG-212-E05]
MKILIATGYSGSWPYVPDMVEELRSRGVTVDIFDIDEPRPARFLDRLAFRFTGLRARTTRSVLRHKLDAMASDYDAVNIHFLHPIYADLLDSLKVRGRRLVASIWGSDFLRANDAQRAVLRDILAQAHVITTNNPEIRQQLQAAYPEAEPKVRIMSYGMRSLSVIDQVLRKETQAQSRAALGVDPDKIIVVCGYNATRAQQHMTMIQAIAALPPDVKARQQFIVQATYPDDAAYKDEIAAALDKAGIAYLMLRENMDLEDICRLRIVSDVTLNIQTTDSLAGSIQEHLYAGSALIVGRWLPYEMFEKMGASVQRVETAAQIAEALAVARRKPDPSVTRPDYVRQIHEAACWGSDSLMEKWLSAYRG